MGTTRSPATRIGLLLILASILGGCGSEVPNASPDGASAFECVGVPLATCEQILQENRNTGPGAAMIVGAKIRCTSATCSEAQGEVSISIVFADGGRSESSYGWAQAGPGGPAPGPAEPGIPVAPTCLGLDQERCLDAARNAVQNQDDPLLIDSITVQCTTVCTSTEGTGKTVVILTDGLKVETDWAYEGE